MFKTYFLAPTIITILTLFICILALLFSVRTRFVDERRFLQGNQERIQREMEMREQEFARNMHRIDEQALMEQQRMQQRMSDAQKQISDLVPAREEALSQGRNLEEQMNRLNAAASPSNEAERLRLALSGQKAEVMGKIDAFNRREDELNREIRDIDDAMKRMEIDTQRQKEAMSDERERWTADSRRRMDEENHPLYPGPRGPALLPPSVLLLIVFPVLTWFGIAFLNVFLVILIRASESMAARPSPGR